MADLAWQAEPEVPLVRLSSVKIQGPFSSSLPVRNIVRAGLFAAVCTTALGTAFAQQTGTSATPSGAPASNTQTTTGVTTAQDGTGRQTPTVSTTTTFTRGKKKDTEGKVVQSKDTKKAIRKDKTADALVGVDSKLPDKQLYDKALLAMNKGHFDVARLDLQTMLNTYPDSQYQMRAKLAIADSWYKEGGTAALTQAESEYADFRVFFPNAPEAAEAQMRIGDIYFRQMDRPDRDYAKSIHAEEEYRRMLTDYPNADPTLTVRAKQRLRDVQEVLASREADIASYYATRENWAAVIARDQTVVDTYPLYSHMDDVLISLGDAYEAQARYIRTMRQMPEGPKARLETIYDSRAADAYREVVLNHSAAPHVEDARDRLAAMNLPIPEPTRDQLAASEALENSRSTYQVSDRLRLLVMHAPDTVTSARLGEPTMTDPALTTAPAVSKQVQADFASALNPAAAPTASGVPAPAAADATTPAAPASTPAVPAGKLTLNDVSTAADEGGTTTGNLTAPTPTAGRGANSVGVEILPPGSNGAPSAATVPASDAAPAANPFGLPVSTAPKELPAVESATGAPDQVNDAAGLKQPAAQQAAADGSKTKAAFDKSDESSSKHKKKKGINKINPF